MAATTRSRMPRLLWPLVAVVATSLATVGAATPAAAGPTSTGPVQYLQVVAHPDDDIFFLNPDVYQSIRAGAPSVTVYVTASEISGNGDTPEQRARSLQRGVEDAYARMAGVPDVNPAAQEEWTGAAWTIGSRQVERYALVSRPEVQLVFMNLHDAGLLGVYDDGVVDTTVVPTGGVVTTSYPYAKADVTSVLSAILTSYHPSVLRYQDPLVDARYQPDHTDHIAAAAFVGDALATYPGVLHEVAYRDYNILNANANLSAAAIERKTFFFDTYSPYDDAATPQNWLERMYYRWPRGTQWVTRTGAGRPQAFDVRNGAVVTWWRTADGSWAGPTQLGGTGGRVVPGVSAVTSTNGKVQVFARRAGDHHLITIGQTVADGGWPATWTDLGNPNIAFGNADQVGLPTGAVNANGTLWLFVKDGGGGVSAKKQNTSGGWGSWLDLNGGADVQDGLSAIRDNQGRVVLFASTRDAILTWRQSATNSSTMVETGSLPMLAGTAPASPPTVTKNQDGTLEVIYREADANGMITTFQTGVGGSWNPTPVRLGGQGGVGQPALVTAPPTTDARIMVFERNDTTGVSTTRQWAPDSPYGSWVDLGGTIIDYPAATLDSNGRAVVLGIGSDGRLYARQQTSATGDAPFGAWALVG